MADTPMVIRVAANIAELKKNLAEGKVQIETTTAGMQKLASSLSGDKLLQQAMNVTAAVNSIGGASKLTEAEMARVNATVTKALEKYEAMGREAPPAMVALADATKQADVSTEGLGARITGLVAAGAAAVAAMREVVAIGVGWVHAAGEQENATVRLDTALRAQGTYTPTLAGQYGQLASQFEKTTVFSDELLMEMQALLVTVGGVMPKDMKAALTASTDLASGLRIDLSSATTLVSKALEGNIGALKRHGIVIDEAKFKTEGATAVFEAIAEKMGGQATSQAATFSGEMTRLGNVINNVEETLGGLIASALKPAIDLFTSLPDSVQTGIIALGLLGTAAVALSVAVAGVGAAIALALPLLGLSAATAGAGALGLLSTAAGAAAAAFWPVAAAIGAVWAAWKIGNTETVKNSIASWALSSDNLTAKLSRLVMGIEKMTPAQAQAALASTAAATAQGKAAAAVEQHAAAVDSFTGPIADLSTRQLAYADLLKKQEKAQQDATAAIKKAADEAKKAAEEHKRFTDSVINLTSAAKGAAVGFGVYGALLPDLSQRSGWFREELDNLEASVNTFHGGISVAGDELQTVTIPMFTTLATGVVPQATEKIKEATKAAASLGDTIKTNLSTALANIPTLLTAAFTGGGGLMGAVKALGVQISEAILKPLEAGLSKVQKAAVGAGAAITAGVGNAAGLGTTANTIIGVGTGLAGAALAASAWGTGMAAAGVAGSVALGAATLGIGAAAVGVAVLIKHWWDHKKAVQEAQKDVAAYEQQIWATLTPLQVAEAQGQTWAASVIGVRDAYLATGRSAAQAEADVAALWASSQLGAAATQAAIDKINVAFIEQKQDATDLDAAIKKYGFSIEQLGPAMQKQQLDEQAKTLLNDWRLLIGSGIDMTVVNEKMASSVTAYLTQARLTGQEVPIAMQPIIQKMIEQGQLTDANGLAITDMSALGVTFSETMTQGFDKVVAKLQELLTKIGMVPAAIAAIPTEKTIHIGYQYEAFSPPSGGGGAIPMASGGDFITTRPTLFVSSEHGRPEHVSFSGEGKTGGSGGGMSTAAMEAELAEIRRLLRDQPRALALAVSDAAVLNRRAA